MPAGPWASNFASVTSAVMLFHWRYSASQRAVPVEAVGEIEPKTDTWRYHHGTTIEEVEREAAGGRGEREMRAVVAAPGADPVDDEDEPDRGTQQEGVVPGDRGEPDEEAGRRVRPRVSRAARAPRTTASPRRAAGRSRSSRAGP